MVSLLTSEGGVKKKKCPQQRAPYPPVALRFFVTEAAPQKDTENSQKDRHRQTDRQTDRQADTDKHESTLLVKKIEMYCQNSTHYIIVVIRLHFLMQNNHVVPSIELLCLYLANSHNLTHYITVVIRLHFLMQNITTLCNPSNYCAYGE